MKNRIIYFCIILTCVINACKKDKDELINEIPKEIIRTKVDSTLYPQIVERFPEWVNPNIKYPYLFSDTIQKQIILTDSSEVYLTFIAENAGLRNTIGWYSYPVENPPKKVEDINLHILFPNASAKGKGGELLQGDMVQLGNKKIPKGTAIGFFLVSNGWEDGKINYNNPTYFTDQFLNKENYQYHILFKENEGRNIILGFEDTSFEKSDKDYNDLLFIVSDNKKGFESIFFNITKLPSI